MRGWQRAGALVRLFAPHNDQFAHPGLATPDAIFAAGYRDEGDSRRSVHTVLPLAELLGLRVQDQYRKGAEAQLAAAAAASGEVVLVAWSHQHLTHLARAIAGESAAIPSAWPDDRFDLIWLFERRGPGWQLRQVPQLLLAGDRIDPIPM